jgi:hypothetical protein
VCSHYKFIMTDCCQVFYSNVLKHADGLQSKRPTKLMSDTWTLHQNTRKMFYLTHLNSAPTDIFFYPKTGSAQSAVSYNTVSEIIQSRTRGTRNILQDKLQKLVGQSELHKTTQSLQEFYNSPLYSMCIISIKININYDS